MVLLRTDSCFLIRLSPSREILWCAIQMPLQWRACCPPYLEVCWQSLQLSATVPPSPHTHLGNSLDTELPCPLWSCPFPRWLTPSEIHAQLQEPDHLARFRTILRALAKAVTGTACNRASHSLPNLPSLPFKRSWFLGNSCMRYLESPA